MSLENQINRAVDQTSMEVSVLDNVAETNNSKRDSKGNIKENQNVPDKLEKIKELNVNVPIELNVKECESDCGNNGQDFQKAPSLPLGKGLESKLIWRRFLGLILALLSTLMFSLNSLMVVLIPNVHIFNTCVWTFLIAGFLALLFVLFTSRCKNKIILQNVIFPINKNYKTIFFVFIRSVSSTGVYVALYFSFDYITIGDSTAITSSATIFVYFFSWVFLREDLDIVIIATGFLAMGGVAVISRPPLLSGSTEMNLDLLIGTSLACCSMVLICISVIMVRFMKNVHYSLVTLSLYIWGTFQSFAFAAPFGVLELPTCQWEWMIIVASGVFNFLAQIFLSSALKHEQAGHVALVRSSGILFSFIWQFVFLGITPDILSLAGALMIAIGIFITIMRKF